jgi:hypothetical protein
MGHRDGLNDVSVACVAGRRGVLIEGHGAGLELWTQEQTVDQAAGPPPQRQSSSHFVETSHERSRGNTNSGTALCHGVTSLLRRAARACCGPPSSSTYGHPAYTVTLGASAAARSATPVSR